jgi:hypothetical protein
LGDPAIPQPEVNAEEGSSQPVIIREIVPELISPYQRMLTYGKMMNDSTVDVSMRVQKTPILGAEFYVDPYDDQPINQEIGEFVAANLFEGMSAPFLNSLEDILHFFEDGYSILEKVFELREWTPKGKGRNTKQYTMLRKLGVRHPSTISLITYDDNGGPTMVTQQAIQGDFTIKEVELDIGKIVVFTFSRRGGDLTGKSLLRTAYAHWYYKTHFYKIDAIQKERHSLGIPRGKLGAAATTDDKSALRTLLRNLRTNEESFIIETPNVDVDFAEVHGNLVNALESAGHHNTMILLNVMAEFMALGLQGSSGSRATGGVQQDIFMKALRYIANYVADVINMYLIPELVVWNYPTKSFPQLKVRNIGETRDLQMLGAALANLLAQSGITMDLATENWIRQVFDMPGKSESDYAVPTAPSTNQDPPADTTPVQGLDKGAAVPQTNGKGNVSVGSRGRGSGNVGTPPTAPQ